MSPLVGRCNALLPGLSSIHKPCLFFCSVFADMLTQHKMHVGISQNEMPAEVGFSFFETPTVIFFP
jgi:hypothetical protein